MLDDRRLEEFIDILNLLKYISGALVICYPVFVRFMAGRRANKQEDRLNDYVKSYNKRLVATQDEKNKAVQKASFYASENKLLYGQVNELKLQLMKIQTQPKPEEDKVVFEDNKDQKSG